MEKIFIEKLESNLWNEFSSISRRYSILFRAILQVLVFLASHVFSSFFIFHLVNFCTKAIQTIYGTSFADLLFYFE